MVEALFRDDMARGGEAAPLEMERVSLYVSITPRSFKGLLAPSLVRLASVYRKVGALPPHPPKDLSSRVLASFSSA